MAENNNEITNETTGQTTEESTGWHFRLKIYKRVQDETVVNRINTIDEYLQNYDALNGNISALISDLRDCKNYLSQTSNAMNNALKINDASFNSSMEGISNLALGFETDIINLDSIITLINSEITSLEEERVEQSNHIYVWKWVDL